MKPGIHNYEDCKRGDTINAKSFTLSGDTPTNLVGATIKVTFTNVRTNNSTTKQIGTGITVTDTIGSVFEIDKFSLSEHGIHDYDIEITFSSGEIKTYVEGTINALNDITK
jgi:hypothetical protein